MTPIDTGGFFTAHIIIRLFSSLDLGWKYSNFPSQSSATSRTPENIYVKGSREIWMSDPVFSVPINERYFEDYLPGPVFEYGPIAVTESEVVDFAKKFDPQYIHTDPAKAASGPFGGLIASGWHTSSLMMRLYADNYLSSVASLASPGIDELRWLKPVRPGDSLWIRVTALDSRLSKSKPDLGVVRVYVEVLNQNREIVMTVKTVNLFRRRPAP
jgi:acyl dehydratase